MHLPLRPTLALGAAALTAAGLAITYLVAVTVVGVPSGPDPNQNARFVVSPGITPLLLGGVVAVVVAATAGWIAAGAVKAWFGRVQSSVGRGSVTALPRASGIREADAFVRVLVDAARERDRSARELLAQRDELAFLLEAVNEGIVQVSSDGTVVRANHAARELLGLGGQFAGQPVRAVIRFPGLREALTRAAESETTGVSDFVLGERHLLVRTRPLADGAGALAVLVDLTDLRRLEDVRRDFVANASHELKTPLTSIRGYAETLLSDDLPADIQRNFIETIRTNAYRLQRIVEDLLDLSRVESGGWSPQFQVTRIGPAALNAWEPFAERAERDAITFVDETGDVSVWADPGALRQIFTNLFDNALRYTPRGGRIAVRASLEANVGTADPAWGADSGRVDSPRGTGAPDTLAPGQAVGAPPVHGTATNRAAPARTAAHPRVVVEVQDTGSGIPTSELPRIFERFYRVDPARSREAGGTGLGLAIVKHLVERMGGEITAASLLGSGTTLRFRLPSRRR